MIKTIRKVGDSLGVTLPTRETRKVLGIGEGTPVQVTIEKGEIRIAPLQRAALPEYTAKRAKQLIKKHVKTLELLAER